MALAVLWAAAASLISWVLPRLPLWFSKWTFWEDSILHHGSSQTCTTQLVPAKIMPHQGQRLEPLKTLHETRANDQFVEALVFEIPAKLASRALSIVKPILQEAPKQPQLHHLRRLVHLQHVPQDLLMRRVVVSRPNLPCIFLIQVATQDLADALLKAFTDDIVKDPALLEYDHVPRCFPVVVPLHAPLSEEQAKLWTERYWPSVFNPAAQLLQDAPPLHVMRKTRAELDTEEIESYINLARHVANSAAESQRGLRIGAVVVDPTSRRIVAAAGDARYYTQLQRSDHSDQGGRPEFHALMRVISMVANKELRRRLAAGSHTKFAQSCSEGISGQALDPVEAHFLRNQAHDSESHREFPELPLPQMSFRGEGYLCSGLDLYLTHEPCVCCAMAMIHSRFRACIFVNGMSYSGALGARVHQSSLGYGLFWRRELNWRVLTFQYKAPSQEHGIVLKDMFHA